MSRPGALLLLTAGVVAASHYVVPSNDTLSNLTEVTRISIAPDRDYRDAQVIPTFSPGGQSFHTTVSKGEADRPAQPLMKSQTWTTVVTSGRSVVSPVTSSRASDPTTRIQLTRDLQRELQRVGCYQGEITGEWSPATRRAMSAFMDRANAVLPSREPDYVLLALVQSHREVSCAADCPSGQVMQDGERCVPAAVVAQVTKRQKQRQDRELSDARLAKARWATATSESASTPQAPAREVLPWQTNQVAVAPVEDAASEPRPELPGRMSVGGPPLPADAAQQPPVVRLEPGVASEATGAAKLAALQDDQDPDQVSDTDTATAAPPSAGEPFPPALHKEKKSHHSDRDGRSRRNSYAYGGRHRHGDPRPGSARFNLMQSLGGIY